MKKVKTIAARVTQSTAKLLNEIAQREDISRSEVIERAVISYAGRSHFPSAREAFDLLQKSGFIGMASTDEALSINYKKMLTGSLDKKHGHR